MIKCRHKESNVFVAIKRFKETDDDALVRKTALREIRMLKRLRFTNVVCLLEAFRRGGRYYLVFEFLEKTVLELIEENQNGMTQESVTFCIWQLLKGLEFLHSQTVVHRDIKPENLLISANGSLKIADFGFARCLESDITLLTEYVSTRWYRAPELLVGYPNYGHAVDVWAVGCLLYEMRTGQPLFPGSSDLDMIARIVRGLGPLPAEQVNSFACNPLYRRHKMPMPRVEGGEWSTHGTSGDPVIEIEAVLEASVLTVVEADFVKACLTLQPSKRPIAADLLTHPLLAHQADALEAKRVAIGARDDSIMGPFRDQIKRMRAEQSKQRLTRDDPARVAESRGARSPAPPRGQFDLPSLQGPTKGSVDHTTGTSGAGSTTDLHGPLSHGKAPRKPGPKLQPTPGRKNPTPVPGPKSVHHLGGHPKISLSPDPSPNVSLPQVSQRLLQFGSGPVSHMHGYNLPGNALRSKKKPQPAGGTRATVSRKQKHRSRATPEAPSQQRPYF